MRWREAARKLRAAGFEERSQHGSHLKFVRSDADGDRTVILPRDKDIPVGTLGSVLRQAGLTRREFEDL